MEGSQNSRKFSLVPTLLDEGRSFADRFLVWRTPKFTLAVFRVRHQTISAVYR